MHNLEKSPVQNNHNIYNLVSYICWATLLFSAATNLLTYNAVAKPAHGLAMHGKLKHPSNFSHFSYTEPNAKKGERLKNALVGFFDSLNPLIPTGTPVPSIRTYVYESLMARAYDEPFSLYGLLAESVEVPEDRSSITFFIDRNAKFSDGKPVTAEDVIFSHKLLRDKGRPNHRTFYSKVKKVEKLGTHKVKFSFEGQDREMPLIMGLMPILPKHLVTPENFSKSSLDIPVGSGPYKVKKIDPGKSIVFKKDPNYWGRNIPSNRGHYNFDEIHFNYYRDHNSLFEAFKRGLYHVRIENDPSRWASAYNFSSIKKQDVAKKQIPLAVPSGMDALVFNTRREMFADKRVRQALTYMFDFEWINKTLFHGLYSRTQSFFDRSELSSSGVPADDHERKLLSSFLKEVDPEVLAGTYKQPATDGSGRSRALRRKALKLFSEAGYALKNGKMIHKRTNKPFTFEILVANRSQERLLLTYSRALKRNGIDVTLRQVDPSQYQARKNNFDFDMIQNWWSASLSPGNEQLFRWSSKAADTQGSYNFPGVKSPAIDAAIEAMLEAKDREKFVSSVRALDRLLISGNYVIPLFHPQGQWVAIWNEVKCPPNISLYGLRLDNCWIEKQ